MRKNVTAITAQRPAMWKDDDQGEPDASPSARRQSGIRRSPESNPASAGFFFSRSTGRQRDHLDLRGAAYMLQQAAERVVPGERFELPTNGLQRH
jgi:hypothetical protein